VGEMRSKCKGWTACRNWGVEEWIIIKWILNKKEYVGVCVG
jgi:hypothetical protein